MKKCYAAPAAATRRWATEAPIPSLPSLVITLIALITLLTGCGDGGGGPGNGEPIPGRITGTTSVGGDTAAGMAASSRAVTGELVRHARPVSMPAPAAGTNEVVPGEVIVRFTSELSRQAREALAVDGVRLEAVRTVAQVGAALFRAEGLDEATTRALARSLATRPDVAYAVPNYLRYSARVPNDPGYVFQWHYPAIELPAAWDVTTGAASVVVAVVDTGILHSFTHPNRTHRYLVGRVVPGYDFISDPNMAGDGDDPDPDPDPYEIVGDLPGGVSSYHGTHVAGTIGARTNVGEGVSGVDWAASILPVRVLGRGGGTMFDIMEGTLWAAGFTIPGVPPNAHPAHVINMSLTAPGPCTPFEKEAFDLIAPSSLRNAVVVVAAGNQNGNAIDFSPASCRNVITVGATDVIGQRSPYSNHGARIDVMAPGGYLSADRNGDGFPDGVLSLTFDDSSGQFTIVFQEGTSMASPHVAGVVSLMKALEPAIGIDTALAVLASTARPLDATRCGRPTGAECGAGLIDAAAAVTAVASGTTLPPTSGLVTEAALLDFGAAEDAIAATLRNTTSAPLAWNVLGYVEALENPGAIPAEALGISAISGVIPANGSDPFVVTIDRSRLAADGFYQFAVVLEAAGSEAWLFARLTRADLSTPELSGPLVVAAFLETSSGELLLSGAAQATGFLDAFAFDALVGDARPITGAERCLELGEVAAHVPQRGLGEVRRKAPRLQHAPQPAELDVQVVAHLGSLRLGPQRRADDVAAVVQGDQGEQLPLAFGEVDRAPEHVGLHRAKQTQPQRRQL